MRSIASKKLRFKTNLQCTAFAKDCDPVCKPYTAVEPNEFEVKNLLTVDVNIRTDLLGLTNLNK